MRRLALLALLVAACGSGATDMPYLITPQQTSGPSDLCANDVSIANANVQDVTALDFAIGDCASLAALSSALDAHPGYLDLAVTSVREFVANRCTDPASILATRPSAICDALATGGGGTLGDLSISRVALTGSVKAGGNASVTIKTVAGAKCSIEVDYNSGPSTASGLGAKTAGSDGRAKWTWKVGVRTAAGSYPISVSCSKGSRTGLLQMTFRVT